MEIGLYGKLPTHGDFLRRRVTDDFVAAWDAWLQQCIAESRVVLGDAWLETYLTSPVWRFALAANVCGAAPVAGLLVPSVDRVGRYFPLTLVWPTPGDYSTLEIAIYFRQAFERAEELVLETLALEQFEFADFDRRVMELAVHFSPSNAEGTLRLTKESATLLSQAAARPRCIPLSGAAALEGPALQLWGCHLDVNPGALGLWWTDGSAAVAPSWLIARGLPEPSQYSAMLDGSWAAAGWEVAAMEAAFDPAATLVRPRELIGSVAVVSAGRSDRGTVRPTNQDAFIERPDLKLWAVADGMGGLSDGEVASRMICDSLADAPMVTTLDEQIELMVGQLQLVNTHLRHAATRPVNPVKSGSTVVALLIRGKECAILWAGDSRVYRLRDGLLSQLTTDHSWAESDPTTTTTEADAQAITRAVGAEDAFTPDIVRCEVQQHDRFLLCSDGLARVLDVAALGSLLQTGDPEACCAQLVAQSIAKGGTDNVTAVIVDCGVVAE